MSAGPADPAEPAEPDGRDALPRDPASHVQEKYKEIRFGAAFAEHIFSRLQRSSALKSVPGVPLRSTPGFSPNSEIWNRARRRPRPRSVGIFCGEESPIVRNYFVQFV
jgi:hypothetical protein